MENRETRLLSNQWRVSCTSQDRQHLASASVNAVSQLESWRRGGKVYQARRRIERAEHPLFSFMFLRNVRFSLG